MAAGEHDGFEGRKSVSTGGEREALARIHDE